MTEKTYKTSAVFVAACAGMAFFGVAMLSLGPILGKLGALVGEGAHSLPSTLSIGIILGTVIFGPVVDKFGYKITAGVFKKGSFSKDTLLFHYLSDYPCDRCLARTGRTGKSHVDAWPVKLFVSH